jgi:hypothetical protein
VDLQRAQTVLRKTLLEEPDFVLSGFTPEERKALALRLQHGGETMQILSTTEYLQKKGVPTSVPLPDGMRYKSDYIPGMVMASSEAMDRIYAEQPTKAAHLKSVFNRNLDLASVTAMYGETRGGSKDPLNMTAYLASGKTMIWERRALGERNREFDPWRENPHGRSVDGWSNAARSFAKSQMQRAEASYYRR